MSAIRTRHFVDLGRCWPRGWCVRVLYAHFNRCLPPKAFGLESHKKREIRQANFIVGGFCEMPFRLASETDALQWLANAFAHRNSPVYQQIFACPQN